MIKSTRQRPMFRLLVLLKLTLLLASCGPKRTPSLGAIQPDITADKYQLILETWTRSDKIYNSLDERLFITATYHSPEFRKAFAIAFPEIYGHGGTVTRRELVDLTGNVEHYHTFFVAAYTPNIKWNDLDKDDSIWRLALLGENNVEVQPEKIVRVKVDENLKIVYPYIGRFDAIYLIRFPLIDELGKPVIRPDSNHFRLRIVSALGTAEPTWKLSPAAPTLLSD